MDVKRKEQLLEKCLSGALSDDERKALFAWLQRPDNEQEARAFLLRLVEENNGSVQLEEEDAGQILAAIFDEDKVRLIQPRKTLWRIGSRWAAAAVVIVIIGLGWFSWHQSQPDKAKITELPQVGDIPAPQGSRATITLANGSQVFLDSMRNGQLVQQGTVKLVKLANGQIAYQTADGQVASELQFNTLTNPRGSQVIDMQLSDGSRVWLNAGSAITYPVAFVGNARSVTLKGEGYFEVAKISFSGEGHAQHDGGKLPFIVAANGTVTEVLGTHFNVNAYHDELETKITLLEGAVRVSPTQPDQPTGGEAKNHRTPNFKPHILKPGEQAVVRHEQLIVNDRPNIEQVIAWKNGVFNFEDTPLEEVMRQLGRWYDIEVVYEKGVNLQTPFFGKISKQNTLNDIITALQESDVHFRIENKRQLIVMP
ncbi:FecR family protein [Chitinophaga defluvii]|uniref:FecR domain-containing protein n=1 Tax=Chitinophaga defluvii TaxID=3163343 RepID=A0ABV2TBH0_9BACT